MKCSLKLQHIFFIWSSSVLAQIVLNVPDQATIKLRYSNQAPRLSPKLRTPQIIFSHLSRLMVKIDNSYGFVNSVIMGLHRNICRSELETVLHGSRLLLLSYRSDSWPSGCNLILTHWGRDKMAPIFQTIFSNAFSRMRMYEFRLRFHWTLFLRFELIIFQHWFR